MMRSVSNLVQNVANSAWRSVWSTYPVQFVWSSFSMAVHLNEGGKPERPN